MKRVVHGFYLILATVFASVIAFAAAPPTIAGATPDGEIWEWAPGRSVDDPAFDAGMRRAMGGGAVVEGPYGPHVLDDAVDLDRGFKLSPDIVSQTVHSVTLYNDEINHNYPGLPLPSDSAGRFQAYQGRLPLDLTWNMTARDIGARFGARNMVLGMAEVAMPPGITFRYFSDDRRYEFRLEFWAFKRYELPNALIHNVQVSPGPNF